MKFFLQQQPVGAQIHVLFPRHQSIHDLGDLGMHQGLPARNADQRRATLFGRVEALLGAQVPLEHVSRVLNFSATRTSQVAAQQRLQHQDHGIMRASFQLLADDVGGHRPHLGYRYCHFTPLADFERTRSILYGTGFRVRGELGNNKNVPCGENQRIAGQPGSGVGIVCAWRTEA